MKLFLVLVILLLSLSLTFNSSILAKDDEDNSGRGGKTSDSSNSDSDNDDKDKDRQEVRIESRRGQTRVEVRERTDGDRTRIKQEIRTPTGKIKFELKDGKTKVKVETKTGGPQAEFNLASPSLDLAEIESSGAEKFKIKIKVKDGRFELKAKGATALTNFPLSLNPETNELSVTTPAGTVLIKTLPQSAVQNILASNVMDRVLGQDVDEEDELEEEEEDEEEELEGQTEVKAEGFVESLTDSQIVVSGVTFSLTEGTKFEGLVGVGTGVEVKGVPQNGVLIAQKVEVEDEVEPGVKIEGVVESVSSDTVVIGGVTFGLSPNTKVKGILRAGQIVELKGQVSTAGALLANKIKVEAPEGEGVVLTEQNGQAVFKIKGQKDARFLGIFPVTVPAEATVSVQTGEVLSLSRPFFLNIFGFLFRT